MEIEPINPPAEGGRFHVEWCGIHLYWVRKEFGMSLINGDKARDNRRHKKVVKMREKREALKAKLAGAQKKK